MKPLLFLFLYSAFLIIGCADNPLTSPSPESEFAQQSLNQQKLVSLPASSNLSDLNKLKLIDDDIITGTDNTSIPTGSKRYTTKKNPKVYASKLIDGAIGGEFIVDTTYFNSRGQIISVYVRLKFDPGSFTGTRRITICPSPEDLSIRFFPHMEFNIETSTQVKLDYIITGIDLQALDYTQGPTDFIYISNNGEIETIQSVDSQVNLLLNCISVHSAQLHHFSRYGWSR